MSNGSVNENLPALSKKESVPEENVRASLSLGNKETITDHYFATNAEDERTSYAFKVYVRLNAKEKIIRKVNFQHSVFEAAYFNACVFDTCDFTGCRFIGCNFHLSKFSGCNFNYAVFERCQLSDEVLEEEAPQEDNLKMRFARTLRMNFQQIGDAKAVNKAISVELQATSSYLKKSWSSKETYYRKKYDGWKRVPQFFMWLEFRILHAVWGNGEHLWKLLTSIAGVHIVIAAYDTISFGNPLNVGDYVASLLTSPGIFLGLPNATDHAYPLLVSALITTTRLVGFALFTAILVKRFGRR
jgi:hypothetical protein